MSRDTRALVQGCWGMKGSKRKALSSDTSDFFQKREDLWGKQEQCPEAAFRLGLEHCWGTSPLWWFFCLFQWVVKPAMGSGLPPTICCACMDPTSHHKELPQNCTAPPPCTHGYVYIYTYIFNVHIYIQLQYIQYAFCVCVFICNWSGTNPSITEPRPQHLPDFSQVVYSGSPALAQVQQEEVRCSLWSPECCGSLLWKKREVCVWGWVRNSSGIQLGHFWHLQGKELIED